jgi:hypothetical protein
MYQKISYKIKSYEYRRVYRVLEKEYKMKMVHTSVLETNLTQIRGKCITPMQESL